MDSDVPKVSKRLAAELAGKPDEEVVEVVIELSTPVQDDGAAGASRAEQIERRRTAFEDWSASVAARLQHAGGELVDRAWINSTLKGVVRADRVSELAEDDKVQKIDSPSTLHAD